MNRQRDTRKAAARDSDFGTLHLEPQRQGQTLDAETRASLEPKFGHSFGDVRVFADGQADQLAQQYQARAFTVGQDVYFRDGEYDPNSPGGLGLLAHELTHTIQQRGAKRDGKPLRVGGHDDSGEREAHTASSRVMMGQTATVQGSAGLSVQCFRGADDEWNKNLDAHQTSRDVNAVQAIPGIGNIFSLGMGLAGTVIPPIDALLGNDERSKRGSRFAEQAYLKAIPGYGNDLALRDAIYDQRAIDNLGSGKAAKPTPTSMQRRDGQIEQFNQDASDGSRGLWDGLRDGVTDLWGGVNDTWDSTREGVKDLWDGATDTPAPMQTNAAQNVSEATASQAFERGATRGKIAPPNGPVTETFGNYDSLLEEIHE